MFERLTHGPEETRALAERFAKYVQDGDVICLVGDLGAGKTLFTQALTHALGVTGEVTSPTFNLMNVYEGKYTIHHFDLYRLENDADLDEIGFYEYTESDEVVSLIEWADKFPESLPETYCRIEIARSKQEDENERRLSFSFLGDNAAKREKELEEGC